MIQLCAHGMNPRSCPSCWQIQAAAQPKEKPKGQVEPPIQPTNNVMPLGEAVMRATQGEAARARIARAAASVENAPQPHVDVRDEPEKYTKEGLLEPPKRRQLIDSLPRNPNANLGSPVYSGGMPPRRG